MERKCKKKILEKRNAANHKQKIFFFRKVCCNKNSNCALSLFIFFALSSSVAAQFGEIASIITGILGSGGAGLAGTGASLAGAGTAAGSGISSALANVAPLYQLAQAALQLTGTGVGIANQASEGAWFPAAVENAARMNREFQDRLLGRTDSPIDALSGRPKIKGKENFSKSTEYGKNFGSGEDADYDGKSEIEGNNENVPSNYIQSKIPSQRPRTIESSLPVLLPGELRNFDTKKYGENIGSASNSQLTTNRNKIMNTKEINPDTGSMENGPKIKIELIKSNSSTHLQPVKVENIEINHDYDEQKHSRENFQRPNFEFNIDEHNNKFQPFIDYGDYATRIEAKDQELLNTKFKDTQINPLDPYEVIIIIFNLKNYFLEDHCKHVKCLNSSEKYDDFYTINGEKSCPEDSFQFVTYVPLDSCCRIISQCRCRLGDCASTTKCMPGHILLLEKKASGQPGNCCDAFICIPASGKDVLHKIGENDTKNVAKFQPVSASTLLKNLKAMMNINSNEETSHLLTHCTDEDGRLFREGERWHKDPCQECACNDGVALCKHMECPKILRACSWIGVPENECCPVCLGCKDDANTNYQIGEFWQKDDCTNCTCGEDFRWSCQKFICKIECSNPIEVKGQCCPQCHEPLIVSAPVVCASLELCDLRCEFGLTQNKWGCFECECANYDKTFTHFTWHTNYLNDSNNYDDNANLTNGEFIGESESVKIVAFDDNNNNTAANCVPLTVINCKKQCAHGYLHDEKNCAVCRCANCPLIEQCYKQCLYGFETNSLGCRVCKCRAKSQSDAYSSTDKVNFTSPLTASSNLNEDAKSERTCFTFSSLSNILIERDSGEWWTDNHCRQCFCQHGTEFCSIIACPSKPKDCPSKLWIRQKGDCCPSCAQNVGLSNLSTLNKNSGYGSRLVCYSPGNGQLYVDGETWQLTKCISCTCRMGHILCTSASCPPLTCTNPIVNSESDTDQCCSSCLESNANETKLLQPIPSSSNNLIVEASDSDVSLCTDNLDLSHQVGSSWKEDECTSCICLANGISKCYTENCDSLDGCEQSLLIKGRCCPICSIALRNGVVCEYKGNIYGVNEKFHDGPCRNCSCLSGSQVECIELECLKNCTDSIIVPGQCCPSCKGSELYLYGNGEIPEILFSGSNNEFFLKSSSTPLESSSNSTSTILYFSVLTFGILFFFLSIVLLLLLWKAIYDKFGYKNSKADRILKKSPKISANTCYREVNYFENKRLIQPLYNADSNNSVIINILPKRNKMDRQRPHSAIFKYESASESLIGDRVSSQLNASVTSTYYLALRSSSEAISTTTIVAESE